MKYITSTRNGKKFEEEMQGFLKEQGSLHYSVYCRLLVGVYAFLSMRVAAFWSRGHRHGFALRCQLMWIPNRRHQCRAEEVSARWRIERGGLALSSRMLHRSSCEHDWRAFASPAHVLLAQALTALTSCSTA